MYYSKRQRILTLQHINDELNWITITHAAIDFNNLRRRYEEFRDDIRKTYKDDLVCVVESERRTAEAIFRAAILKKQGIRTVMQALTDVIRLGLSDSFTVTRFALMVLRNYDSKKYYNRLVYIIDERRDEMRSFLSQMKTDYSNAQNILR